MRCTLLFASSFIAGAFASPVSNYVSHEKRAAPPPGWSRGHKLAHNEVLPISIALAQSNLHNLDDYLMDVSHPSSENYGKHWDLDTIAKAFAPSKETVDLVSSWLTNFGISTDRIKNSLSGGWLKFNATIHEAENLLKTEYHVYKHESGVSYVACDEYHLPQHIQKHVDFITPTVHFDVRVPRNENESKYQVSKRTLLEKKDNKFTRRDLDTSQTAVVDQTNGDPNEGDSVSNEPKQADVSNCGSYITPDCLRALYNVPVNNITANGNSFGIVEYTPNAYTPDDLDLFFSNFDDRLVGERPKLEGIDGGFIQTQYTGPTYNAESDLDLEYGMSLVYPQEVTLFQVGDITGSASFNTFLDAIDGSYCSFEGGDDPDQDPTYPVPKGSYTGTNQCGRFPPTKVISTSFSYDEADLTPFYARRQCQEYAKLGLSGVTFVFSSGDYGVAGHQHRCLDSETKQFNNGSSGSFSPSFPSTCPYVTSVGATQIIPGNTVDDPEEACQTNIYSGGGFSNVFPLPGYQAGTVSKWWREHLPPYTSDQFNNSRTARGIPDVSANGANYATGVLGGVYLLYGTSAAAPTFASILTLINQQRLLVGKGPIGFINPTIYAHPELFNDITLGSNPGCGTNGFDAVPGWDPVTGLGTPDYPKMLKHWLS